MPGQVDRKLCSGKWIVTLENRFSLKHRKLVSSSVPHSGLTAKHDAHVPHQPFPPGSEVLRSADEEKTEIPTSSCHADSLAAAAHAGDGSGSSEVDTIPKMPVSAVINYTSSTLTRPLHLQRKNKRFSRSRSRGHVANASMNSRIAGPARTFRREPSWAPATDKSRQPRSRRKHRKLHTSTDDSLSTTTEIGRRRSASLHSSCVLGRQKNRSQFRKYDEILERSSPFKSHPNIPDSDATPANLSPDDVGRPPGEVDNDLRDSTMANPAKYWEPERRVDSSAIVFRRPRDRPKRHKPVDLADNVSVASEPVTSHSTSQRTSVLGQEKNKSLLKNSKVSEYLSPVKTHQNGSESGAMAVTSSLRPPGHVDNESEDLKMLNPASCSQPERPAESSAIVFRRPRGRPKMSQSVDDNVSVASEPVRSRTTSRRTSVLGQKNRSNLQNSEVQEYSSPVKSHQNNSESGAMTAISSLKPPDHVNESEDLKMLNPASCSQPERPAESSAIVFRRPRGRPKMPEPVDDNVSVASEPVRSRTTSRRTSVLGQKKNRSNLQNSEVQEYSSPVKSHQNNSESGAMTAISSLKPPDHVNESEDLKMLNPASCSQPERPAESSAIVFRRPRGRPKMSQSVDDNVSVASEPVRSRTTSRRTSVLGQKKNRSNLQNSEVQEYSSPVKSHQNNSESGAMTAISSLKPPDHVNESEDLKMLNPASCSQPERPAESSAIVFRRPRGRPKMSQSVDDNVSVASEPVRSRTTSLRTSVLGQKNRSNLQNSEVQEFSPPIKSHQNVYESGATADVSSLRPLGSVDNESGDLKILSPANYSKSERPVEASAIVFRRPKGRTKINKSVDLADNVSLASEPVRRPSTSRRKSVLGQEKNRSRLKNSEVQEFSPPVKSHRNVSESGATATVSSLSPRGRVDNESEDLNILSPANRSKPERPLEASAIVFRRPRGRTKINKSVDLADNVSLASEPVRRPSTSRRKSVLGQEKNRSHLKNSEVQEFSPPVKSHRNVTESGAMAAVSSLRPRGRVDNESEDLNILSAANRSKPERPLEASAIVFRRPRGRPKINKSVDLADNVSVVSEPVRSHSSSCTSVLDQEKNSSHLKDSEVHKFSSPVKNHQNVSESVASAAISSPRSLGHVDNESEDLPMASTAKFSLSEPKVVFLRPEGRPRVHDESLTDSYIGRRGNEKKSLISAESGACVPTESLSVAEGENSLIVKAHQKPVGGFIGECQPIVLLHRLNSHDVSRHVASLSNVAHGNDFGEHLCEKTESADWHQFMSTNCCEHLPETVSIDHQAGDGAQCTMKHNNHSDKNVRYSTLRPFSDSSEKFEIRFEQVVDNEYIFGVEGSKKAEKRTFERALGTEEKDCKMKRLKEKEEKNTGLELNRTESEEMVKVDERKVEKEDENKSKEKELPGSPFVPLCSIHEKNFEENTSSDHHGNFRKDLPHVSSIACQADGEGVADKNVKYSRIQLLDDSSSDESDAAQTGEEGEEDKFAGEVSHKHLKRSMEVALGMEQENLKRKKGVMAEEVMEADRTEKEGKQNEGERMKRKMEAVGEDKENESILFAEGDKEMKEKEMSRRGVENSAFKMIVNDCREVVEVHGGGVEDKQNMQVLGLEDSVKSSAQEKDNVCDEEEEEVDDNYDGGSDSEVEGEEDEDEPVVVDLEEEEEEGEEEEEEGEEECTGREDESVGAEEQSHGDNPNQQYSFYLEEIEKAFMRSDIIRKKQRINDLLEKYMTLQKMYDQRGEELQNLQEKYEPLLRTARDVEAQREMLVAWEKQLVTDQEHAKNLKKQYNKPCQACAERSHRQMEMEDQIAEMKRSEQALTERLEASERRCMETEKLLAEMAEELQRCHMTENRQCLVKHDIMKYHNRRDRLMMECSVLEEKKRNLSRSEQALLKQQQQRSLSANCGVMTVNFKANERQEDPEDATAQTSEAHSSTDSIIVDVEGSDSDDEWELVMDNTDSSERNLSSN